MRRPSSLCAAAAVLLLAAAAGAQPAPGAPSPAAPPPPAPAPPAAGIEMPSPLTPLVAEYPSGATGDAVVVVKLVVEKDGSVTSAEVAQGKEPFAAAAVAAAKGFRFTPARRDGVPVRAAIRAEVKFTAPRPADVTNTASQQPPDSRSTGFPASPLSPDSQPADGQPAGAPASPAPPPVPEPIDVSVKGAVTPAGATTMSRAEVRLLPGAFGDPFRAIEALPGVTPIASGLPYFFVRGAPPGNVGYYLDGIRVPLLYHLGLGPSVVHPAIVDRVDLYPGGYPAQIGRFAGGIVSGETRAPRHDINGEAVIRLVDAGAMLEVPFDGGRGSALAGGRYSYTGLLFSILQSTVKLDYWDYQARVSYDLTPTDTVSVFAFGARDYLGDKGDDGEERTLVDTTFHRVDLRYDKKLFDRRLGAEGALRHAFTFGWEETAFDGGSARDLLLSLRSVARLSPSRALTLRAGTDATLDIVSTTLGNTEIGDDIPIRLSDRFDVAAGVWADAVVTLGDRLDLVPGLRLDLYGSTGNGGAAALALEPRLAATLRVTPWLRLVQAHGLASQRPSFLLPGPGFSPDLVGGLQRSFQTSAGVEADLPLDIEAKLVFFRNAFFDMTDPFGTSTFTGLDFDDPDRRTMGSSVGMEISTRRRMTKRVGGFFAYTLSRSERIAGKDRSLASTNRTHVLSAALAVDIARGFRAGARAVFYTGYPDVRPGPDSASPTVDTGNELPPFFRLDGRLEKRWSLGGPRWISVVLEMQNATLSTETLAVRCELTCEPVTIGPVAIPSLGVEGGL